MAKEVKVDKEELKKKLTPLQYQVTQEKGTEPRFGGCYDKIYDQGLYVCIVCEQPLFSSDTKYDSGCGWPAFNEVLDQGKIKLTPDVVELPDRGDTEIMEVTCSMCNSHLGHLFENEKKSSTTKRFCINSASVNFIPKEQKAGDS